MVVMESTVHPGVEKLRSFGQGRLPADDAAAVEEHLADCDTCCFLLEETPADSFVGRLRKAKDQTSEVLETSEVFQNLHKAQADTHINHAGLTPAPADDEPFELADHPRYRVVRLLGQGGMGAVYLAEHRHMGRAVALKVINSDLLNHPRSLPRFQQEARAAAKLDHPNIVAAYDADHAASLHFLVMEYVEGQNLADYLAEKGPLPVAEACHIIRQAALGLQHAHERGMVHRDIKPHNLMLTPSSQVKVLDFGLARFAADQPIQTSEVLKASEVFNLTGAGAVVGTTDYIAPEQAQDAHVADGRADFYSLGCTLYHLLTGKPPFPEGTASEKLRRHAADEPRLMREQRADVPDGLASIVSRMMAKKPEDRYQTSAEVAAALAPFTPQAKPPNHLVERNSFRSKSAERNKFRSTLFVLAGLAAVVLSGLLAAGVVRIPAGPDREIEIKTDDPNIEVIVKGDRIVRIVDPKTGKAYQLDRHDLTLSLADDPDGLSVVLDGKRPIQLKRHGKQIAIVRLVKKGESLASGEEQAKLQAAKDFATAEFHERSKNFKSAMFYYQLVQRHFFGTPFADKAERRMAALRESQHASDPEQPEPPLLRGKTSSALPGPVLAQTPWADKLFLAKGTTSHDFGTVLRGTQLKHRFRLKNVYKVPLEISDIIASAGGGMTWNESTKILKPNEEGYIDIKMDARLFIGPRKVYIYVTVGREYVSTAILQVTAVTLQEEDFNTESFFNGKNLFGWQGLPGYWKVHNGAIIGAPANGAKRHTLLCSEKTYRDFELKFKVKRKGGIGNSGVQIRSRIDNAERFTVTGPQIEIESANFHFPPGSIVTEPVGKPFVKANAAAVGDVWKDDGFNDMTIRCEGKWVTVTINGVQVLDSHFPTMPAEGIIAWQLHGGGYGIVAPEEVIFKDIHFRELNTNQVLDADSVWNLQNLGNGNQKPTAGYTALFNGRDLTGWKNHPDNPGDWRVEHGVLVGRGPAKNSLYTVSGHYEDFHLRVEAKINAGGNSGLQFRKAFTSKVASSDGYEAQIDCDNHPARTGSLFVKGGTATVKVERSPVPIDTWFTQEVIARGNHIIILVNGKKVVDYVDHDRTWSRGHLALQLYEPETVVRFRRIEVKKLARSVGEHRKFVPLFNGKMTGWVKEGGNHNSWRVEDDELVGSRENNSSTGFILTPKSYANLRLRFQYQLSPGANSGVGLRAIPGETAEGHNFPYHLEVQILDDNKYRKEDGTMDCPTGSIFWSKGSRGYLRPDKLAHLKPVGSWNEMEIELRGQSLQVWVNGRLVQDADMKKLAAQSEALPGLKRTSGRIGFQQHTGQVRFRNIQIEEPPDNSTSSTSGYQGAPATIPPSAPDRLRLPSKFC